MTPDKAKRCYLCDRPSGIPGLDGPFVCAPCRRYHQLPEPPKPAPKPEPKEQGGTFSARTANDRQPGDEMWRCSNCHFMLAVPEGTATARCPVCGVYMVPDPDPRLYARWSSSPSADTGTFTLDKFNAAMRLASIPTPDDGPIDYGPPVD